MTITSKLHLQNAGADAHEVRRFMGSLTGDASGVMAAGDLAVSETAGGATMAVDVAAGRCLIVGTENALQGTYFVENGGVVTLPIGAADVTNARIDLVVARVQDSTYSGGVDDMTLEIVAGVAAATPSAPTLPENSLLLKTVNVPAGASEILTSNLSGTAKRLNTGSNAAPVGTMHPFAGSASPDTDFWLLCDGSAVSRTDYPALFAAIGETYGAGDGSTTFNVPKMNGRVPMGLDNMGGTPADLVLAAAADVLGGELGASGTTLTEANLPEHSHSIDHGHSGSTDSAGGHTHDTEIFTQPGGDFGVSIDVVSAIDGFVLAPDIAQLPSSTAGGHTHPVTVNGHSGDSGNTGSGTAFSNMQPSLAVSYLIRAA